MARNNGKFVAENVIGTVQITDGSYRNQPVNGTYNLVVDYKDGVRGGFVTVEATDELIENPQPGQKVRVKVDPANIVVSKTEEQQTSRVPQVEYYTLREYYNNNVQDCSYDAFRKRVQRGKVNLDLVDGTDSNGRTCKKVRVAV